MPNATPAPRIPSILRREIISTAVSFLMLNLPDCKILASPLLGGGLCLRKGALSLSIILSPLRTRYLWGLQVAECLVGRGELTELSDTARLSCHKRSESRIATHSRCGGKECEVRG
jgi:hypothetical protein